MKYMRRSPHHDLAHRPQCAQIGNFYLRYRNQFINDLNQDAVQNEINKNEAKHHTSTQIPLRCLQSVWKLIGWGVDTHSADPPIAPEFTSIQAIRSPS